MKRQRDRRTTATLTAWIGDCTEHDGRTADSRKNVSVATRIAIMLVALVSPTLTFVFSTESLDHPFEATLNARFAATRAGKTDELTRYLASIERRTADLTESPMTIDAVNRPP